MRLLTPERAGTAPGTAAPLCHHCHWCHWERDRASNQHHRLLWDTKAAGKLAQVERGAAKLTPLMEGCGREGKNKDKRSRDVWRRGK